MKIKEYIQRIQSLYSKGVESDDSRLTDRHIFNKMNTVRSKLINQKIKKNQKVSQWNYQILPCVELIEAPIHECPCLPPVGCKILKTKHPLPKPLTDMNNHKIQSVTSLDGSIIYSEITWIAKKYKNSNKYTAKKPDYFIRNNHLYITHKGGPKIITIEGLFEDLLEVKNFPSVCPDDDCVDCNCESILDQEFEVDAEQSETLIGLCVEELIQYFSAGVEDLTNNSKDNLDNQTK